MRKDEGFILPTTMVVIFFCLLIITHISTAAISEKKFYSETEQYYIVDQLMLIAVEDSLKQLQATEADNEKTIYKSTSIGDISYSYVKVSPEIYEVQLKCTTLKNKDYTAKYQYDTAKNEMIVWSEY